MAVYTWNPAPIFEARQINDLADGEAWVASLTDFELRNDNDGVVLTNVRIETSPLAGQFRLLWTRTDTTDGTQSLWRDASFGGYAIADKTGQVALWVEDEASFNQRFQPYVECP